MTEDGSKEDAFHLAGDRLGKFVILSELGRGSMGVVYEAFQEDLKRKVAIKILPANISLDSKQVKRFRREAESVARLRHDNIIQIYEVDQLDNTHYFVMELVEGKSLGDYTESAGVREAARIIRDAARGLAHAHERGVIHRDIKPSNLLLDRDGRVLVTDFGLARLTDSASLTSTDAIVGTPKYMSPEQILPGTYPMDGRTDVYSLGATLYESVTGRAPLDAPSVQAFIRCILEDRPVSPRRFNREVPHDLCTVVLRCLEKSPGERYAGAAALADDLDRFLAGDRIVAKPKGAVAIAFEAVRRHRLIASVATVAVVALLASLFLVGSTAKATREKQVYTQLNELRATDDIDYAVQRAEALATQNPNHPDVMELRADLYHRRARARLREFTVDFGEVAHDLERAGRAGSYWHMMLLFEANRIEEVRELVPTLPGSAPGHSLVRARLALAEERPADAVRLLTAPGYVRDAYAYLVLSRAYRALAREAVRTDPEQAREQLDRAHETLKAARPLADVLDQKWLRGQISDEFRTIYALLYGTTPEEAYLPFVSVGVEKTLATAADFWRSIQTPEAEFGRRVLALAQAVGKTAAEQEEIAGRHIAEGRAGIGHLLLALLRLNEGRTAAAEDALDEADLDLELQPYVWWGRSIVLRTREQVAEAITASIQGLDATLTGKFDELKAPLVRFAGTLAQEARRQNLPAAAERTIEFLEGNRDQFADELVNDALTRARSSTAVPAPQR